MILKKITLSEERNVYFKLMLHENSMEMQPYITRPMVIICPGGGYAFLSDREADIVAFKYLAAGFHTAVLYYGIKEHAVMPGPLKDLAATVALIREHSKEWFVNSEQIFVSGFSAGGHVAACLGVYWNNPKLLPEYASCPELIKPNGMILGYPVINLYATQKHMDIGIKPYTPIDQIEFGQIHPKMPIDKIFIFDKKENRFFVDFENAMNAFIFDGEYTKAMEDEFSLNQHVDSSTAPAFLWHAADDDLIYPSNSIEFALALYNARVPYELHIYGNGGHGISLANYIVANNSNQIVPNAEGWIDLAIDWVYRQTGFKEAIKATF